MALVGTIVCWGATPVFLKALTGHVDAWTANGVRYPFAASLYWPLLAIAWRQGRLDKRVWKLAIGPAIFSFGGQVFFAWSHYYLDASAIGFLIKIAILFTIVFAMVYVPEERGLLYAPQFWLGLAVAIGGFVTFAVTGGALKNGVTGVGVLLSLCCAAFFGLYGFSVRYYLHTVPPFVAFGAVAQFVAAGTLTLFFVMGKPSSLSTVDSTGWILLGTSALIGIGISHSLYFVAIQRLGASVAACGHLVGPFVTLLVANLALGEVMSEFQVACGCVLVAGGAWLHFGSLVQRKRRHPETRR
ncbi:MAG: DMT family transporter [Planctomycetota bacterium]